MAMCFDAFQEPVIQRLKEMDVDIFLQPSANPGPWNDWQQEDWLRGDVESGGEGRHRGVRRQPDAGRQFAGRGV